MLRADTLLAPKQGRCLIKIEVLSLKRSYPKHQKQIISVRKAVDEFLSTHMFATQVSESWSWMGSEGCPFNAASFYQCCSSCWLDSSLCCQGGPLQYPLLSILFSKGAWLTPRKFTFMRWEWVWDPSSCSTMDIAKLANASLSLGEDICIRMSICYVIQTDSPIKAKTKQLLEKKLNLSPITLIIQIAISFWDPDPERPRITQLGKPRSRSLPSWLLQLERKGFSPGFR